MNRRSRYSLYSLLLLFFPLFVSGQNESDVLRYFNVSPVGTARVSSMAGSFGALGGDLSSVSINPAGSAIYKRSEIVLTPGFTLNSVESSSEGLSNIDSKNKLVFSNLGYVTTTASEDTKDFYIAYSMGYNKLKDFNRISTLDFMNANSSMLFSFTDRANGIPVYYLPDEDPFVANLAYEAYLIDPVDDTSNYYSTQPLYELSFNGVGQSNRIEEKGALGEVFFNLGLAVKEKLHFGASLAFVSGNYEQSLSFREATTVDTLLLDNFIFRYNQKSDLSGLNFKLGFIYKPENWIRLALAWHLPYQLQVNDVFSTSVRSQFKDGEFFDIESPEGALEYSLKNPGKWIFSTAFVIKDKGLLNLDFEWIDYGQSKIRSSDFDFSVENGIISQSLRNTLTVRIGGEIWLNRYNFRAGYSLRQNPFVKSTEAFIDFYNTYSLGAGFITDNNIYFNISANYQQDSHSYYTYNEDIAPRIEDRYNSLLILASLGVRF